MKKQKIALVALLSFVLSVCCLIFAACGDNTASYKITWSYANATVAATGYDALPEEAKEGTEITFTVTPAQGYQVTSVKQGKATLKESNGAYTFTVSADTEITVTLTEILSSITVTKPTKLTYYAGDMLDKTGMSVTANYATGKTEAVTAYTVAYNNGSAFALGDTYFTVSYGGISEKVELSGAVKGLVTVDLYGGELSDDVLNVWKTYPDYSYNTETGVITWTFDKAFEEDFVLPTADGISKVVNEVEFTFKGWTGVSDNKIAKGTDTSVSATAYYEPKLLELSALQLTTETVDETEVPYLIVTGKFMAATEAYLYLYEGNDKVELKGTTITKGTTNDFVLKFDLRELVKSGYAEKWMDIKFCATFGDRVETQEINLNDYADDFVDYLTKIVVNISDYTDVDNGWYSFSFEIYEHTLKVVYYSSSEPTAPEYSLTKTTLETRGTGDEEKAYLVVTGQYLVENATKADAEKYLEGCFHELMDLSWISASFNLSVTVADDLTFEITVSLENLSKGKTYFIHSNVFGNDKNNFVATSLTTLDRGAVVTVGSTVYTLGMGCAWDAKLIVVNVTNAITLNDEVTNVSLETANDVVYLVIKGNYDSDIDGSVAKTEFEKYAIQLQQYSSWEYITAGGSGEANSVFTVEAANGKFTIKVALSDESYTNSISEGKYVYTHYNGNDFKGSESLITSSTVTADGLNYTLVIGIDTSTDDWTQNLVIVKVTAAQ